ncbi:hypothetical protein B0H14DRAFT_3083946 [Mycena olivaceomarginata]|nr:hypothetical protein B0H14DRAFT_3083946 [Mycena olivaceomarginata]
MEANGEGDLSLSADQQAVASIAEAILECFADLPMSDNEFEERSDDEEAPSNEPEVAGQDESDTEDPNPEETRSRKRARTRDATATSSFWYPWPDRITCTLDILMHLPRSVFSQRQLDLFLWLLKVNNVNDVPSVKSMQTINLALQKICGIDSIPYDGALGHKYYVNSLAQIIAQEMANPKVRPHLHFYPEDSGPKLSEARQGQQWLNELPDERTTPMARIAGKDYYIHKPAMLSNGQCVVPVQWFAKGGQLFAKCWQMLVVTKENSSGWHVVDAGTMKSTMWKYTNPVVGNRWRSKAEGHRVVAFPIWMYCDDTSGNISKKWNEHNSFLMTPAGLPREHSQKEYNIYFLCTSNLARPLEMLDGIVEQLEQAQDEGIWAWDMLEEEPVLVIPEVLALLGDNPMQSEFACHIGLRGKLFCRACWVKGTDAMDQDDNKHIDVVNQHARGGDTASPANSAPGSPALSVAGQGKGKKGKARKIHELMSQMVDRVGHLRHKEETTSKLRSYFTEASTVNTKTKVKNSQTENGIKDKYQTHFIEQLFDSYKNKRGVAAKQAALDAKKAELPKVTISPVWRIKGLDPHQDTPVEILHVVLLGFIQLNKKDEKKELLATRLSSLDVSSLGISPLAAGQTLVRYSGSLTGRDFRAISQVAPFVLYDLVSDDCFKTWQALSKIVPLIWQPEIDDIESHIALLTKEIEHFLLCAARWTNCWFNKPKFHIFVHLPAHIRRFGPAILFATEAFESFNAIIRAKSVHSNRHAPSRDIAYAFVQGNRIRHLISGANTPATPVPPTAPTMILNIPIQQSRKHNWTTVGPGPQSLTATRSTVTSYLGLNQKKAVAGGLCIHDKHHPREVQATLSGVHIPTWAAKPGLFQTNQSLSLCNGDICVPGGFVIVWDSQTVGQTFVARVEEIIQQVGSLAIFSSQPDGVLLQRAFIDLSSHAIWNAINTTLKPMDLLCTVNVQHNCIDNKCGPTGARTIFQERFKTNQTQAEIVHTRNVQDIVLNTAQMRDAIHLQMFLSPI